MTMGTVSIFFNPVVACQLSHLISCAVENRHDVHCPSVAPHTPLCHISSSNKLVPVWTSFLDSSNRPHYEMNRTVTALCWMNHQYLY